MSEQTKLCAVCGREIVWRRSMARDWDAVKRCSAACRRRRLGTMDRALEEAIEGLLAQRARGATICPSEAARVVSPDGWRPLMSQTRDAARRLVAAGRVEITQKGRVVNPSRAKGPIRIRRTS